MFAVTNNLPLKRWPAGHARPRRGVPGLVVALRPALPAADVRGWAAARGVDPVHGKCTSAGPGGATGEAEGRNGGFRASLRLGESSVTQSSGLSALGCKASSHPNSSAGGGPSLERERFGETSNYSAEKQDREGCWEQNWSEGSKGVSWRRGHPDWVLKDEWKLAEEWGRDLPGRRNSVSKGTEA